MGSRGASVVILTKDSWGAYQMTSGKGLQSTLALPMLLPDFPAMNPRPRSSKSPTSTKHFFQAYRHFPPPTPVLSQITEETVSCGTRKTQWGALDVS